MLIDGNYFSMDWSSVVAVGCPRLKVGEYAWVKQDETTAKVKCNKTEETWYLACSGRQWNGELGNCSGDGSPGK